MGEIEAPGYTFLDDHRIVAFGTGEDYTYGEAKEIDLERRTVRDIDVQGLTMSVVPTFVVDGEIALCEEKEFDSGSGPSCASTRILDPATGKTRPLPENPEPTVSNTGEYLFTDQDVWVSRKVGDEVIYWMDEDDLEDHQGRFDLLRAGSLAGPSPESDRASAVAVHLMDAISPTTDGQRVVIDATPKEGGGGISVCDVATLDCSELPFASRPPYAAPEWSPIGVLPSAALG